MNPKNVFQSDYKHLAEATSMEWAECEVKEYLHEFFGLDPNMIKNIRQVEQTEISRHLKFRTIGYYDRPRSMWQPTGIIFASTAA